MNGAPELPAASRCPDRAAHTSQAHRAGGGPSPPHQDVLTVHAFTGLGHGKGIQSPVHGSDESVIKTCITFCFLHVPHEGIP